MIKLNAGFSRKVGEPNYGSRGAAVNVELEVESNLINDGSALLDRVRGLFRLARQAVDDELRNGQSTNGDRTGNASRAANNGNGRRVTQSQLRAIRAIASGLGIDADRTARERFDVAAAEQLSLQQASALIDQLKAMQTSGASK